MDDRPNELSRPLVAIKSIAYRYGKIGIHNSKIASFCDINGTSRTATNMCVNVKEIIMEKQV